MNIRDVIQTLEDLAQVHDNGDETELRIAAFYHRTKMEYKIDDIVFVELLEDGEEEGEGRPFVYFVESNSDEYLPSRARKAIDGEL